MTPTPVISPRGAPMRILPAVFLRPFSTFLAGAPPLDLLRSMKVLMKATDGVVLLKSATTATGSVAARIAPAVRHCTAHAVTQVPNAAEASDPYAGLDLT